MPLHVHEWGDPAGPPLVCLHGVTGHGARFRKLGRERLADRRVIALDLRGHGRSDWEPPWDVASHVGDALASVEGFGIERADWLGFSFGGRVVAELAATAPERVEKLVLLDPAIQVPAEKCLEAADEERGDWSFETEDEAIEERMSGGALLHTPREFLVEEMHDHLQRDPDGRLRYRYSPSAAVVAWSEMAREAPAVARVPTLLVIGSASYVDNDEQAKRYEAALGDDLTVVTLDSGHPVLWDAFEETADAVSSFLSTAEPRS
jgi:lipase